MRAEVQPWLSGMFLGFGAVASRLGSKPDSTEDPMCMVLLCYKGKGPPVSVCVQFGGVTAHVSPSSIGLWFKNYEVRPGASSCCVASKREEYN
ncbi:hypothetical protein AVEN_110494-1 [Araneus ventricosus]|uniref:Uncharacterized protein n=1 Tax=Araneus ventricosus TaxID=182803 RepID=A0A4Y2WJQ6_ARAVE|nr:hypothetical protein AVEN_110494-1 [Araneus ventricosus]